MIESRRLIRRDTIKWRCILCGTIQKSIPIEPVRESCLCVACGSSWRARAVTFGLILGLGLPQKPVVEWDSDWSICGVGFDDDPSIFSMLPTKVIYVNTHLEKYPRLDLRHIPDSTRESMRFLICSDVLEHVEPPVEDGFTGLYSLLQPGGLAVVSVPVHGAGPTNEFYPDLVHFEVLPDASVRWRDSHGQERIDKDPEYHGGTGLVLSFRTFGVEEFKSRLINVGFKSVQELPSNPEFGIFEIQNHGVFYAST